MVFQSLQKASEDGQGDVEQDTEAAAEIECDFTGLIIIKETNEQAPLWTAEEDTEDAEFE